MIIIINNKGSCSCDPFVSSTKLFFERFWKRGVKENLKKNKLISCFFR